MAATQLGAYGIAMTGEALGPDAARWLPSVPADWPAWELRRMPADPAARPAHESIDDGHCRVLLWNDAWAELDRSAQTITLHLAAGEPAGTVLHPASTLPTMVVAHWRGQLSLHAGAVLLHGGVWGVLGHKEAGKSTTLAALDAAGHPVLADDMLVYDDGDVLSGPRFVDLRAGAAQHFPQAIDCGHMGLRQRFRLPLRPAPLRAPFAGWLLPTWTEDDDHTPAQANASGHEPKPEITVRAVPPAERLDALGGLLNVRRPPKHPVHLLDLAAKPLLQVARPKRFDALPAYLDAIVGATAAYAAATAPTAAGAHA